MRLRIATYNIHRGIGIDGKEDLARICEVVREICPHVIALQEVGYQSRSSRNVGRWMAQELQAEMVPGITLSDEAGDYGNALLSRLPVETVRRHDLSVRGREPRGMLEVALRANGPSVRVLATHLGLRAAERRGQIARIEKALSAAPADIDVLLGDFNEWLPFSRSLRRLHRPFQRTGATPLTFPARRPLLALDRIWVRPASRLGALQAHRSALSCLASDHLPLVAELDLSDALSASAAED